MQTSGLGLAGCGKEAFDDRAGDHIIRFGRDDQKISPESGQDAEGIRLPPAAGPADGGGEGGTEGEVVGAAGVDGWYEQNQIFHREGAQELDGGIPAHAGPDQGQGFPAGVAYNGGGLVGPGVQGGAQEAPAGLTVSDEVETDRGKIVFIKRSP